MNRTLIEWVVNPDGSRPGWSWSPTTGCLNHINGLCKGGGFPCYAYKLANTRLKQRYLANLNLAKIECKSVYAEHEIEPEEMFDPFYPRFWEDRLRELSLLPGPDTDPQRKGIFVCDMSDLFGLGIPEEWTKEVIEHIRWNKQHRFYLLTKQPQNLIKFSPFPENCWVGVTATNEKMLANAIEHLNSIEAMVKFISLEPLLSWNTPFDYLVWESLWRAHIGLIIVGACTGSKKDMEELCKRYPNLTLMHWKGNIWTAQPQIQWLREIVSAADKAGVKVFLKDNLKPLLPEATPFYTFPWGNDPEAGIAVLRQQMPELQG
jgi:protein gp37